MNTPAHIIQEGGENNSVHPLEVAPDGVRMKSAIIIFLITAGAGILTGFLIFFAGGMLKTSSSISSAKVKETVGIKDKKTFKDSAEGILAEGGIEGEGQFHLQRPGGAAQNVYLTSTTVDLSEFIGKKIRVWGETFAAEKAGWLMDVGLVEVL